MDADHSGPAGLALRGCWPDEVDPWWFRAVLVRIVDADTIDVLCDTGFGQWSHQRLRLALEVRPKVIGLNAPEVRGPEREAGLVAKEALTALLWRHSYSKGYGPITLVVRTAKRRGKYGRYLATVHGLDDVNICRLLVDGGHAVEKNY